MKKSVTLQYIHYRIFGYATTIIMHTVNIACMFRQHQGDHKDPTIKLFKNHLYIFFTTWTFTLQIVYAVAGLICDILILINANNENYKLNKYFRGFRDILFAGIQWPSTLLVASLFWGIFNYDRELVLPQILDQVLTLPSNHIIHTAIVPVIIWELVFQPRKVPRSHKRNLGHLFLHFVLYFTTLFYTYYQTGAWPYPILAHVYGTIFFPLFLLFLVIMLCIYYYIQWPLTRLIWGDLDGKKMQ